MNLSRFDFKRASAAALVLACSAVNVFGQAVDDSPAGQRPSETLATEIPLPAATEESTVFSVAAGVEVSSHFVSYGLDVWGGDDSLSPFGDRSTVFGYGTVTMAVSDELSLYLNLWGEVNDNVDSEIGGNVQEIDVNVGFSYVVDKFTFTAAVGQWIYAGDVEGIIDVGVGYNDSGLYEGIAGPDFALNPSFMVHYRFDPNGAQEDDSAAFVFGIKPTFGYTFSGLEDYPISLTVPTSVAFFTDGFQGGDSGFGYFTTGVRGTVPLAFIPAKYGAWTASAGISYYLTEEDAIPGNPEEDFFVSSITVDVGF